MRKGKKAEISQEELQKAVNKFLVEGGNIEKLPDQKVLLKNKVGEKWRNTELGG